MIREYSLMRENKRTLLCHFKNGKTIIKVFMEPINDKTDEFLDRFLNKEFFNGYTNSEGNIVNKDLILTYGKVNLNKKQDLELLKTLPIIDYDKGFRAYSTFNYEKGTVTAEENKRLLTWYDSWNPVINFMQKHCEINKPKKIIIYKEIVNIKRHY